MRRRASTSPPQERQVQLHDYADSTMVPEKPRNADATRPEDELAAGSHARLEAAWRVPMRERLARLNRLCREIGQLKGAATRRR